MFIKSVISFILAHIIGFGAVNTKVYEAPLSTTSDVAVAAVSITPTPILTQNKPTPSPPPPSTPLPSKKPTQPTPTKVVAKPVTTPKPTTEPPQAEKQTLSLPIVDFEKVNTAARIAILNIICTTKGGELSPISGTGVMISQKGVILTNAHIGQYFLLKDFLEKNFVQCIVRTGSPAYPTYNAELVYISPTWVKNNSVVIKESNPTGTGENDFAFLRITGRIDGSGLPTDGFPYLTPNIREVIVQNEPVILISYPAGFLGGLSILQNLNVTSSITNIKNVFTFKTNTIDLIDVGGTIVSQKGSSGGAVIDSFVSLLGIITTSSEANTTDQRELRAITLAHINRALKNELGFDLDAFLKQDPSELSKTFSSTTAPVLTKILTDTLSGQ